MIGDAVEWLRGRDRANPWLLLGQGPSLDQYLKLDLRRYTTFGLNRVVRLLDVDVCHFSDIETFHECQDHDRIKERCRTKIIIPWYPHTNHRSGKQTLDAWCKRSPTLKKLRDEERLLSYNSSLAWKKPRNPRWPIIRVKVFSGVAAFNLLAAAGVRVVCSLGIDGGESYSRAFPKSTCLNNGQDNFDVQFREIDKTLREYKMRHVPLGRRR